MPDPFYVTKSRDVLSIYQQESSAVLRSTELRVCSAARPILEMYFRCLCDDDMSIMADTSKNCYNFSIHLKVYDLEDYTL